MKKKALATALLISIALGLIPIGFTELDPLSPALCHAFSPIKELQVLGRVSVSEKRVTLLDLCDRSFIPEDWRIILSKADIGETPAVGSEKFVEASALQSYLKQFIDAQGIDSSTIKISVPERVIVTRESVQLTEIQIEEIFRKFVLEHTPWPPQDVAIQKVNISGLPIVPAGKLTWDIVPAPRERFTGNVSITLNLFVDGEKVRTLNVAGKVEVHQNVYHAARAMKQNDVITPMDVTLRRVNITDSPERYATQPDQVINKRVAKNVGINQAIDLKIVEKPLAVKKGDAVTILYNQPGLHVTAKGQAQQEGSVGETVKISNVTSNKTIFARIMDSQTVQAVR